MFSVKAATTSQEEHMVQSVEPLTDRPIHAFVCTQVRQGPQCRLRDSVFETKAKSNLSSSSSSSSLSSSISSSISSSSSSSTSSSPSSSLPLLPHVPKAEEQHIKLLENTHSLSAMEATATFPFSDPAETTVNTDVYSAAVANSLGSPMHTDSYFSPNGSCTTDLGEDGTISCFFQKSPYSIRETKPLQVDGLSLPIKSDRLAAVKLVYCYGSASGVHTDEDDIESAGLMGLELMRLKQAVGLGLGPGRPEQNAKNSRASTKQRPSTPNLHETIPIARFESRQIDKFDGDDNRQMSEKQGIDSTIEDSDKLYNLSSHCPESTGELDVNVESIVKSQIKGPSTSPKLPIDPVASDILSSSETNCRELLEPSSPILPASLGPNQRFSDMTLCSQFPGALISSSQNICLPASNSPPTSMQLNHSQFEKSIATPSARDPEAGRMYSDEKPEAPTMQNFIQATEVVEETGLTSFDCEFVGAKDKDGPQFSEEAMSPFVGTLSPCEGRLPGKHESEQIAAISVLAHTRRERKCLHSSMNTAFHKR